MNITDAVSTVGVSNENQFHSLETRYDKIATCFYNWWTIFEDYNPSLGLHDRTTSFYLKIRYSNVGLQGICDS